MDLRITESIADSSTNIKMPYTKGTSLCLVHTAEASTCVFFLCKGNFPSHKTSATSDLKATTTLNLTFCDKWQTKATTDKVLFLLCTVYDILSSVYSSSHGCAKSSCCCGVAAQPAYIMSPFSDRFIDFALRSAPSLKLFNTRTNWDRYVPTAQNRSLANWKGWTLSSTDLYTTMRRNGKRKNVPHRSMPFVLVINASG